MSRQAGYYWVKVRPDSKWDVLYTDGVAWRCRERTLRDHDLYDVREERLPEPDERPQTVAVPTYVWNQAMIASEAIRAGDTGSTEAALNKMRHLMEGSE